MIGGRTATRADDGPLRRFTCCAIDWIAPAAGESIVRRLENKLAEVLAGQGGALVKSNPVRRVYRLGLKEGRGDAGTGGRGEEEKTGREREGARARIQEQDGCAISEVYLKCFDERLPGAWVKRRIRGPAGRVEFSRTRQAWLAGAPVPQPLACGVDRHGSYLLTAGCQAGEGEVESFGDWLAGHGWDEQAARSLVELLIASYSAGLLHDDLHVGNILYRPGAGCPGMWLLDLGRARVRENFRAKDIIASLALLTAGLAGWLSEENIEAFLAAFLARANECWPGELPAKPEFLVALRATIRRRQAAGLRHRLRGILKTNNYFARVRLAGRWAGHVYLHRRTQRLDANSPAAGLRVSAVEWIAALDRLVRATEAMDRPRPQTLQIGEQRVDVIVERGCARSGWAVFAGLVRGPAARRLFAAHAALMVPNEDAGEKKESADYTDSADSKSGDLGANHRATKAAEYAALQKRLRREEKRQQAAALPKPSKPTGGKKNEINTLPLAAIQRRTGLASVEWVIVSVPQ